MPELAKQYSQRYMNGEQYNYRQPPAYEGYPKVVNNPVQTFQQQQRPKVVRRKVQQKSNLMSRIVAIAIVMLIGIFVLPISFKQVTGSFLHGSQYPNLKADYQQLRFPTSNYLSNHWFLGERSLRGARAKKPLMTTLQERQELTTIKNQLIGLMAAYPTIHSSVYVWDYQNGDYVDLNADEIFAAASIIKLPVLVHLFKSIEAGQFTIYDEMVLTDFYRAEGSGSLQFKATDSKYSMDKLARIMITESDNSSTNMIMAKLGSMNDVNHGIREWGLKDTHIQSWLPDLGGTNKTTAKEMAKILYNIDNPNFLSVSSREKIFDYMGNVHNNRLIEAGLGNGAVFLHKTGDIGKMLGDAGIVFAPSGNKYIVVILANRPHNSPQGKEFIVKASEIIYNNMVR